MGPSYKICLSSFWRKTFGGGPKKFKNFVGPFKNKNIPKFHFFFVKTRLNVKDSTFASQEEFYLHIT